MKMSKQLKKIFNQKEKNEALISAIIDRDEAKVILALDRGAQIDFHGQLPLRWAARQGDEKMARLLRKEGACEEDAIAEAARCGYQDELKNLVAYWPASKTAKTFKEILNGQRTDLRRDRRS